jgi:hypothetical protein
LTETESIGKEPEKYEKASKIGKSSIFDAFEIAIFLF